MNSDTNKNNERNRDSVNRSNDSLPKNSPQSNNGFVPSKKRVYCQQGILESREDFARRMYQAMVDAGIIPGKAPSQQVSPDRPRKIRYYPGCSWFRVLGSKR